MALSSGDLCWLDDDGVAPLTALREPQETQGFPTSERATLWSETAGGASREVAWSRRGYAPAPTTTAPALSVDAAYAYCRGVARAIARTFYYGSLFLPASKRRAAWALYAFCRTADDIADEPMPRIIGADPAWAAFWRLEPRPDGRPVPEGPEIQDLEDKFEVVAAGEALVVTAYPTGIRLRPDLTSVPLHGVEPSQVVLAVRAADRGRLVTAFRKVARTHITRPDPR